MLQSQPCSAPFTKKDVEYIFEKTILLLEKYRVDVINIPRFATSEHKRSIRELNHDAKPESVTRAVRNILTKNNIYTAKNSHSISMEVMEAIIGCIDEVASVNCIKAENYPDFKMELDEIAAKILSN